MIGDEPTPEFAAIVTEQCQRLLGCLADDVLRNTALWRMEGYTNGEIAKRLDVSRRSVERKVAVIRATWSEEGLGNG